MIRSKGISLALFSILSIISMVGCGGSVTSQDKTSPQPTPTPQPAAAQVFNGTFNLTFTDSSGPDAMDVQIAFNQADTNVTGKGVPHTATYTRTGLSGCIDLAASTVTQGTVQGSNFALILTDPNRQTVNISGSISPLQGNYNISFPASCLYGRSMSGTLTFQKMGV